MKPALFSPRKVLLPVFTAIAVLTVVGWICWYVSAAHYRHIIDGWVQEGIAGGDKITYDERQVFGFPLRLTMRLIHLHWTGADGIDFHTDDMDIVVTPWNWSNFDVKFKNHVTLTAPLDTEGHALLLTSDSGLAHVELNGNNVWRNSKLALSGATIGVAPHYVFAADMLEAAISRPDIAPKDHTQVGLTIEGEADKIALPDAMPSPFGTKADKFVTHMRVMGAVPDVRVRDSVDAWNKDSGIVEFDDFSLRWGLLELKAKGTVGFDDDLQPEGAFAATIANPQKTFQALIDHNFIAMHDKDMLAAAMDVFATPSARSDKGFDIPITVQLGGLFFGPIRIFTFPAIEWPVKPPAVTP